MCCLAVEMMVRLSLQLRDLVVKLDAALCTGGHAAYAAPLCREASPCGSAFSQESREEVATAMCALDTSAVNWKQQSIQVPISQQTV